MEIEKRTLLRIIERLSKEIDMNCIDHLEFDEQYYWEINEDELFDPLKTPEINALGDISEDWKELSRLANAEEISISYDLKRLGVILSLLQKNLRADWFNHNT